MREVAYGILADSNRPYPCCYVEQVNAPSVIVFFSFISREAIGSEYTVAIFKVKPKSK